MKESYQIEDVLDREKLASFLAKEGQHLLPFVNLVEGTRLVIPEFMKEIIASISIEARRHSEINQNSGVSVRMTIDNYENMASQALKRALINHEREAAPRISDLAFTAASSMGKIEFDCLEPERDHLVMHQVVNAAVRKVFFQHFQADPFHAFLRSLGEDAEIEISELTPARAIIDILRQSGLPLDEVQARVDGSAESVLASALEMVLEGLHQQGLLGKRISGPDVIYAKGGASIGANSGEGKRA